MAVSGKSARRLLKFLLTTDPPEIHAALEGLANQLDNDVELLTGKLSERPAFKLFGRMFYVQGDATAANNGVLWLDLGGAWAEVNPVTAATTTFTSWGYVSEAGAIEAGTGDYTVAKTGAGVYEVKWTKAKTSANYAVNVTPDYVGRATARIHTRATTGFIVEIVLVSPEELHSEAFSFIAMAAS